MTDVTLIPEIVKADMTADAARGLIERFLMNDPTYLQMDEANKNCVTDGILRELSQIDRKHMVPIDDNKEWYLKSDVPHYLANMLEGQMANSVSNTGPGKHVNALQGSEAVGRRR